MFSEDKGAIFVFDYGAIVTWGLSRKEEEAVLSTLHPFEEDSVDELLNDSIHSPHDSNQSESGMDPGIIKSRNIQVESLQYRYEIAYDSSVPSRIEQDIVTVVIDAPASTGNSAMSLDQGPVLFKRLAVTHAIAQSVKVHLFWKI